ncbi:MAG TPA: hypothetical protein QF720_06910 [Nitrospinota bacterium]|jgi:hypothetical protein|nr:hypothetical protein [Nitrospinota bacterium]|tara:strand:+ start:87238 stop:87627 length:390 start_codon:yes stop_codon:yes gene_type:complete
MRDDKGHKEAQKTVKYLDCPNCGCPSKNKDSKCPFCNEPLPDHLDNTSKAFDSATSLSKALNKEDNLVSVNRNTGKTFTLILGFTLAMLGGWFIVRGFAPLNFPEFLIGGLFLLYGVYAITRTIRSKSG